VLQDDEVEGAMSTKGAQAGGGVVGPVPFHAGALQSFSYRRGTPIVIVHDQDFGRSASLRHR
jgi:hypothetical protein